MNDAPDRQTDLSSTRVFEYALRAPSCKCWSKCAESQEGGMQHDRGVGYFGHQRLLMYGVCEVVGAIGRISCINPLHHSPADAAPLNFE